MQKTPLLILVLLVGALNAYGSGYTIGNSWRWSKDVGTINTRDADAWLKPVNVAPVISLPQPLRLRMLTSTQSGYSLANQDTLILEYRIEPQANSATGSNTDAIKVNANSATAGAWNRVNAENPSTSNAAFVIDPDYDDTQTGALVDRSYGLYTNGTYNLLYSHNARVSNSLVSISRSDELSNDADAARQGAIGLSKSAVLHRGSIPAVQNIPRGGMEVEYRLVVTKNAEPGTVYYFRMRNVRSSGNGAGTVDPWDYAAGYPSIAISKDFYGSVNPDLPNIGVQLVFANSTQFSDGESKSGNLIISNLGGIASVGDIIGTFNVPAGWVLSSSSIPANWTLSPGTTTRTLSTSVSVPSPSVVTFPITVTAPSTPGGNGGVLNFTLGNSAGNAGGDGTAFNNRGSIALFKQ